MNCYEVKWATFIQDIFTYAKLLALFIIIGTGIVQLGRGKTENFTWTDTETDITKIALSFYSGATSVVPEFFLQLFLSGLFAYNGWNYLNFVIEEMKDPVRDLPRAIMISCITVTIVYVTTNIAFYTTLNVPEVLGSEAVAVVSTFYSSSVIRNINRPFCRPLLEGCTANLPSSSPWLWLFPPLVGSMAFFLPLPGTNPTNWHADFSHLNKVASYLSFGTFQNFILVQ